MQKLFPILKILCKLSRKVEDSQISFIIRDVSCRMLILLIAILLKSFTARTIEIIKFFREFLKNLFFFVCLNLVFET